MKYFDSRGTHVKTEPLWLHQGLLKLLDFLGQQAHDELQPKQIGKDRFESELSIDNDSAFILLRAGLCLGEPYYVFDCRALPTEFVYDSGESFLEEPPEVQGPVRIPHPSCYFEFSDKLAIYVASARTIDDQEIAVFTAAPVLYFVIQGEEKNNTMISLGHFENQSDRPVMQTFEGSSFEQHRFAQRGGKLVLGVLTLLRDRLLLSEAAPDPKPWVNRKRQQHGKLPLSSARNILTVNVAAVRQATSGTRLGHHESPALHWRRGHWRMLHRDSDEARRTWVRRCLVGDPDRGFVSHREFKLVDDPGKIAVPTHTPTPT